MAMCIIVQDVALPYGGIDGCWGGRRLFRCTPRHGLLVPVSSTVRERDVRQPAFGKRTFVRGFAAERVQRNDVPTSLRFGGTWNGTSSFILGTSNDKLEIGNEDARRAFVVPEKQKKK